MKFETLYTIIIYLVGISVLVYYGLYAYAIAMTPDGVVIEEYKIKGVCINEEAWGGVYEVIVKTSDSQYEIWNVPINSRFIISEESKISKFTEIFKTSYIIYYNDIQMCRR